MLFVTLKNLQTRSEKVVQFCIAGIGNEHGLKRIVDCLVIGDLIIGIGFVKRGAPSFLSSGLFGVRRLTRAFLVPLCCGFTLSFLTNARAWSLTAV